MNQQAVDHAKRELDEAVKTVQGALTRHRRYSRMTQERNERDVPKGADWPLMADLWWQVCERRADIALQDHHAASLHAEELRVKLTKSWETPEPSAG